MKKVLREEIAKQRKLMNLSEQLDKSFSDKVYDYVVGGLKSFFPDEEKPEPKPAESKVKFAEVFKNIIEKIEGGYYHPDMVRDGRLRNAGRMGDSGETMFGIDRKNGPKIINDTPNGKQFWSIIDKAGARKKWPWNYRGGRDEGRLTVLATKLVEGAYEDFSKRYLTAEAKKIVDANKGLLTHFGYAAWNGQGWFKDFADSINAEVKRGVKDPTKLLKKGLTDRKKAPNRLISDSAEKIEQILNTNLV
jgi:hypothetical protein